MTDVAGTDKKDNIDATKGVDKLTGGAGKDTFFFRASPSNFKTLDDQDRITDYESKEDIVISGVHLNKDNRDQVKLEYDEKSKNTKLKIDLDDDGTFETTIILDGDQRGRLQVDRNCCTEEETTIRIVKDAAPKTSITEINVTGANFIDTFGFPVHEGGVGNDIFDVRGGQDTVFAGDGDDIISGGAGNDILNGQEGNDLIGGDEVLSQTVVLNVMSIFRT